MANSDHKTSALRRCVQGKMIMRCRFKHKWDRKIFDGSLFYVRTCERCGAIQRGIYGTWETIRERTYIKSQQFGIIRQPSTRGDQLAHTLKLRRSRASDRTASGQRSEKRKDRRVDSALFVSLEKARGVTRDVSASGAFFWTSGAYAVGEPISFAIEHNTPTGRMISKCRGDVLRTEPQDHMVGVAASIKELTIESA